MKLPLIFFAFFMWRRSMVVGQMTVDSLPARSSTAVPVVSITPEGQQSLMDRLETIENAFRAIVSALSNQPSDLFAPIKETLVKDPSLRSFLSSTSFLSDTGSSNTNGTGNESLENTTPLTKEILQQGKHMVDNLKGVVKCSLAHMVDINSIGDSNTGVNGSALISASFTSNESVEINWLIPSAECIKLSTGVWVTVYQSGDENQWPAETLVSVPQKCIKKKSKTSYSLILSPPSLSASDKEDPCSFFLTRNLTQCRSYVVEVIANYQSLRGKTLRTEIVVPPKLTEEAKTKSLLTAVANGDVLKLNWADNSGCQPQMTSLNLKIIQDGFVDSQNPNISTLVIPRSCLKQDASDENLFTMVLPSNQQTCPIEWKPLNKCRKYRLEMSSQYTATWNGHSTSVEIITKGYEAANISINSNDIIWRCPRNHFYCNHYCTSNYGVVCNGNNDCYNGRDEHHCDPVCKDGFKCGRQCIPKELVCNGEFDCLDGTDEDYSCSYGNMCQHFVNSSGTFSSLVLPRPANGIDHSRISLAVRKTAILLSVQRSHQIWLTFKKCVTYENQHFVKVYDGPYSTSPLLLSRSGTQTPFSVRSSSNELYVEFPSYYDAQYGIVATYTSVSKIPLEEREKLISIFTSGKFQINATRKQFIQGCGGYIKGDGVVSTPNYSANLDVTDCFWFLEAKNSEDTVVLSGSEFISVQRMQSTAPYPRNIRHITTHNEFFLDNTITPKYNFTGFSTASTASPTVSSPPATGPFLVIYDGWSTAGLVLYNEGADAEKRAVTYSISNKMMIHLKSPVSREDPVLNWTVFSIPEPQCNYTFDGPSGIIKSPNYPLVYTHLSDCRWNINVQPGSKIRLLFAFFETQEQADFFYVFDGPTVYAKLIFEKSGSPTTPFEVTSTTNQVLIRFTSDANTALPGFLVVYSEV